MKAVSPVLPQRDSPGCGAFTLRCPAERSLPGARRRTAEEELLCLRYTMNDCYSRLKRLVPTIPQDKKVSKVEILQHVIDYILDLQLALETHPDAVDGAQHRTGVVDHPEAGGHDLVSLKRGAVVCVPAADPKPTLLRNERSLEAAAGAFQTRNTSHTLPQRQ
ncbi:hypothetical protein Z043-115445 [Arapaima gigas]